jgi:Sensors of blue-light using FAD
MNLIHCIYTSSATHGFAEAQLPELLERARAKNALHGITGMLLYVERSFFQVLEGEPGEVDAIYRSIEKDPRHHRMVQIIREPIARRSFEDWSMGFAAIGRAEAAGLVGENDFFGDAECFERIQSGRAKKLLRAFESGRWRNEQTGLHQVRTA